MRLGRANVDALGRSLTAKQFVEWEAYARIEPFNELRADYRAAQIVAMIANVNRGKGQKAVTLDDVRLKFETVEVAAATATQTWQQKKSMAELIVAAFNTPGKDL